MADLAAALSRADSNLDDSLDRLSQLVRPYVRFYR